MVEREYDSLIQDVLDGVATPEQVARLEGHMSRDPAIRARHRELQELFVALRKVPRVEAPPDLRTSILRALPSGAPGIRAVSTGPRIRTRIAYVFAAGLAAGIIGASALTGLWKVPSPAGEPASGTMMPSQPVVPAPSALNRSWQAGATKVDAAAWHAGSSRLVTFRVRGGDAEIEVRFDSERLSPIVFRQSPNRAGRAVFEPGRVVFRGSDHGEYFVEFLAPEQASPPLRVTVREGAAEASGDLPTTP